MKLVYLDNAATTKMSKRVIEEMTESFENIYGNPSSTHTLGQKAKAVVENARHIVAKNLKVEAKEIVFTSGGAEGNNLVIKGFLKQNKDKGKHIITTKIEHSTVLKTFESLEKQGYDVTYIDVTKDGIIDVEKLKKAVRKDTALVSVMFVNNETGVIQPIKEIGEFLKEKEIFFHTDAVQAIGKFEIYPKELRIDALTVSSHKFYGPKGTGFVFIDKKYNIEKEIFGGSQERNRRAGTENVNGILGTGVALEEVYEKMEVIFEHEKKIQEYLEEKLKNEIEYLKTRDRKENIKIKILEADLHEASDVKRVMNNIISGFKGQLQTIPYKLAPLVIGIDNLGEIQEIITNNINSVLLELSEYDRSKFLKNREYVNNDDEEGQ
mgnify:CR=1 FL=1